MAICTTIHLPTYLHCISSSHLSVFQIFLIQSYCFASTSNPTQPSSCLALASIFHLSPSGPRSSMPDKTSSHSSFASVPLQLSAPLLLLLILARTRCLPVCHKIPIPYWLLALSRSLPPHPSCLFFFSLSPTHSYASVVPSISLFIDPLLPSSTSRWRWRWHLWASPRLASSSLVAGNVSFLLTYFSLLSFLTVLCWRLVSRVALLFLLHSSIHS